MNRRVCAWIGSVLGCALCWTAVGGTGSSAWGQALPPASAAAAALVPLQPLETAVTVTPGQQSSVIGTFIAAQMTALQQADGPNVTLARAALVAGCPRTASPSYHDAYTAELSTAAVKVLSTANTPLPVKVNLGVVIERVATNSGAVQIMPAVLKLLADRADAVAYWGCKAARPVVLSVVLQPGFNGKSPLFPAIVASVKQHATGDLAGFIATEAYRALVVNPNNVPGMPAGQVWPKIKVLYDPVLDLLELRTSMYAKGIVPSPDAEVNVPTFLSKADEYTPAQKVRASQDLVNLLDAAGQRVQPGATPQVLAQLRPTLSNAASALDVFGGTSSLSTIYRMPPGVTAQNMSTLCTGAYASISLAIPTVKKPPTLPPLPPPAPTATVVPAPAK